MALDGCLTIVRYLLIGCNCLLVMAGVAMVGVGIWIAVDPDGGQVLDSNLLVENPTVISYSSVTDFSLLCILAYFLIGLGLFVVLVTVLDIVGAVVQRRAVLSIAVSLLCLALVVMVGGGMYLYVKRRDIDVSEDELYPLLRKSLQDAVKKYHDDDASTNFMNKVQEKFMCCGADNGGGDYAPIIRLPCNILYSSTPCLPPYFKHVKEHIGIEPFFESRMTIGVAFIFGTAGLLVIAMILTGIVIYVAGRGAAEL